MLYQAASAIDTSRLTDNRNEHSIKAVELEVLVGLELDSEVCDIVKVLSNVGMFATYELCTTLLKVSSIEGEVVHFAALITFQMQIAQSKNYISWLRVTDHPHSLPAREVDPAIISTGVQTLLAELLIVITAEAQRSGAM